MYLRTNAPDKDRYVTLFHQTLYSGPLTIVPTEEDIQAVANGSGHVRHVNEDIRADEKIAAKQALAFGGMGPSPYEN